MEEKQNRKFEQKIVSILEQQQQAIRNNLQLQIANFIIGVFLFIFIILIWVIK